VGYDHGFSLLASFSYTYYRRPGDLKAEPVGSFLRLVIGCAVFMMTLTYDSCYSHVIQKP
jgi:hypothetical protein